MSFFLFFFLFHQLHVGEVDKSSLNFSSHRTDTKMLCLGHITTVAYMLQYLFGNLIGSHSEVDGGCDGLS